MRALEGFKSTNADDWRAYVYRVARNASLRATRKAVRRGPTWSLDKDMHVGQDRDGYNLYDYIDDDTDLLEDLATKQMREICIQGNGLTEREQVAVIKRLLRIHMGEHEHSAKNAKRKLQKQWHGLDNTKTIK